MKKYVKTIILLTFVFSLIISHEVNANQNINIQIYGKKIYFSEETGEPFIDNNKRTQVPFRIVLEEAGAEVTWDSKNV